MKVLWLIAGLVLVGAIVFGVRFVKSFAAEQDLEDKLQAGALVLDVRTPREYEKGHYPGAVNIPVKQLGKRLEEVGDRGRPIIVYCAAGVRAASAQRVLIKAGFTDVTNGVSMKRIPPREP